MDAHPEADVSDAKDRKWDQKDAVDYYKEPQNEGGTTPARPDGDAKVADGSVQRPVQPPAPEITKAPDPASHTPPAAESNEKK